MFPFAHCHMIFHAFPCHVHFHPASPCKILQESAVGKRPMSGRCSEDVHYPLEEVRPIKFMACDILKSPCCFRLAMHQPLGSNDEPLYSQKAANTKVAKGSNKHWPTEMLVMLLAMVLLMALFLYDSILSSIEFTADKSWSTSCANCTSIRQTDSLCFGSCSCREGVRLLSGKLSFATQGGHCRQHLSLDSARFRVKCLLKNHF